MSRYRVMRPPDLRAAPPAGFNGSRRPGVRGGGGALRVEAATLGLAGLAEVAAPGSAAYVWRLYKLAGAMVVSSAGIGALPVAGAIEARVDHNDPSRDGDVRDAPSHVKRPDGALWGPLLRARGGAALAAGTCRVYVDRGAALVRRLLNEGERVMALAARGLEIARREGLAAAKVALRRGASVVVNCRGAGLTKLVFAAPRRQIAELMPTTTVNWSDRFPTVGDGHPYQSVVAHRLPLAGVAPLWTSWVASKSAVPSVLDE